MDHNRRFQLILWLDDDNKPLQTSDHRLYSMAPLQPLALEDTPRLVSEPKITASPDQARNATPLHQRG
jgi:hypothetical protein